MNKISIRFALGQRTAATAVGLLFGVMTLPAWAAPSPIAELQTQVAALQQTVNNQAGRIATLQRTVANQGTQITRLQNTVTAPTTDPASPAPDTVRAPAIDVSSLPAIESINARSNVAVFLKPGVPDDLARAALHKAWVSDPAIRDFVGIAENQWDFNTEGTIAGYGSLSPEEYARLVAPGALLPSSAATVRTR